MYDAKVPTNKKLKVSSVSLSVFRSVQWALTANLNCP